MGEMMRRRILFAWVAAGLCGLALGGSACVIQVTANVEFDAAFIQYAAARDAAQAQIRSLGEATEASSRMTRALETALTVTDSAVIDQQHRIVLTMGKNATAQAASAADRIHLDWQSAMPQKPLWAWELVDTTEHLRESTQSLRSSTGLFETVTTMSMTAVDNIGRAGLATLQFAASRAPQIEAENTPATEKALASFHDAVGRLRATTSFDAQGAADFVTYAESVEQLRVSHAVTAK